MAQPINLNKARKARDKAQAKAVAAQNRVSFGRTKADKAAQAAERGRQTRDIDGHERER